MKNKLEFEKETYEILGARFEVYKDKGNGFLEAPYQECMEIELELRGVPFVAQQTLPLEYKGRRLKSTYQPDLVVYDKIIVELKAVTKLADEHRAQVHNYLKASGQRIGMLVNFGHYPGIEHERIIR